MFRVTPEEVSFEPAAAVAAAEELGLSIDEAEAEGLLASWEAKRCRSFLLDQEKEARYAAEKTAENARLASELANLKARLARELPPALAVFDAAVATMPARTIGGYHDEHANWKERFAVWLAALRLTNVFVRPYVEVQRPAPVKPQASEDDSNGPGGAFMRI